MTHKVHLCEAPKLRRRVGGEVGVKRLVGVRFPFLCLKPLYTFLNFQTRKKKLLVYDQ